MMVKFKMEKDRFPYLTTTLTADTLTHGKPADMVTWTVRLFEDTDLPTLWIPKESGISIFAKTEIRLDLNRSRL